MKLYSQSLEEIAIRSICDAPSEEVKANLLASLDESYFQSEPCIAAFKRVHSIAKKRSTILSFTELVEDPALNEEFRDILRESSSKICKTIKRANSLLDKLRDYRKTRIMYYMAKSILDDLKKPQVEVEDLLNKATVQLTDARNTNGIEKSILTIGHKANAIGLVDEALSVEDEVFLQTGFADLDERHGGMPSEGVALLAATTSGGKSTVLMNLLMNIYKLNKVSVNNVSLEMNERKLTRRMLSRMTGIPYWKFTKKALNPQERQQAKDAWLKFHKFGEKYGCQFGMYCPVHAVTDVQLFTLLRPYGYKVVGLDYVSLLDGVDEDNQARVLSAIVRHAKIFSAENKCLVIILVQLDSVDNRIRYSRGMLEHADVALAWNYSKPEVRETKIIPVQVLKARDQELGTFELEELFEIMTVKNEGNKRSSEAQDSPIEEQADSSSRSSSRRSERSHSSSSRSGRNSERSRSSSSGRDRNKKPAESDGDDVGITYESGVR